MKKIFYTGICMLLIIACKKDDKPANDPSETNRITYVVADNPFNFSIFNTAIQRTGHTRKLSQAGPYTALVPDNNAFAKAGYGTSLQILKESASTLNSMIDYHILSGVWELNKLPYAFNQEIRTDAGAKMYVTRWVKNKDTVLTVNGNRVLVYNMPAGNGLIQVMNAVLKPLLHNYLTDAIAADTSLTFLNVAFQQAGMKGLLAEAGPYTMFAPSNNAFRAIGFPSADSINRTDPAVLRKLLDYTFFPGRKFIYDYILTTDATDISQQAMRNGNNIIIRLRKDGTGYTGITLQGSGNLNTINIVKENVLAGNGVLHIADQMLKENQ